MNKTLSKLLVTKSIHITQLDFYSLAKKLECISPKIIQFIIDKKIL